MHFERGVRAHTKSAPFDLVTEADRASGAVIAAVLTKAFPDHGVIAEEGGKSGACVTDPQGTALDLWTGSVVASNGHIHGEILARLRQANPDCPMQSFVLH